MSMKLWSSLGFNMIFMASMLLIIFLMNLIWKWNKTLVFILILESSSVVLLGLLISLNSAGVLFFLAFVFFVGEALVVLSSLYTSLNLVGNVMTIPIV